jgi:hypothetical protein
MSVQGIKLPDEPILILQLTAPADPLTDTQKMQQYIAQAMPQVEGMLYIISDFSQADLSFSDVVVGMAEFSREIVLAPNAMPFIPVLVGSSRMVTLMAEAAHQDQYGHLNLPVYATLNEALDNIRSVMVV